ncbi:MAG TPA: flagellar motor switch protein FliN [Solirubrobacteraceae bacterium]|nr:flagellar motor switch protein FliN [Solirubrobacteraceae bacterium]
MSEAVVYEQFEQDGAGGAGGLGGEADADLRRLSEVPLELSVEIGRTGMTVGETLELRPGSIVTLDRLAGEAVDLLVNGTPIARGEVVVVDEQFGLRVTEIVEGDPAAALAESAAEEQQPFAPPAPSAPAAQ